MVPFERALVTSYRPSIVTFRLSLRVSEILTNPALASVKAHCKEHHWYTLLNQVSIMFLLCVDVCLSESVLLLVAVVWPAYLRLWSDRIKPGINDAGRWRCSDAV